MEHGLISVDGRPATLGQKIEGTERIIVQNRVIHRRSTTKPRVYLAYHKPVGIICTSDPHARDNIIDAVQYKERLFHVGRLDVASSGLILLTNDGGIVNPLLRAEEGHEKEYIVEVDKPLTKPFLAHMAEGVFLDGQKTLPAKVVRMGPTLFSLTLIEGRNRQIRRMCEALGYEVVRLKRIRIMHIRLDNIPPGKWRHLTETEIHKLQQALQIPSHSS